MDPVESMSAVLTVVRFANFDVDARCLNSNSALRRGRLSTESSDLLYLISSIGKVRSGEFVTAQ